jgi:hypothetical protein
MHFQVLPSPCFFDCLYVGEKVEWIRDEGEGGEREGRGTEEGGKGTEQALTRYRWD